ncbi:MAG: PBP1A family penicillin-binding protein [Firmicutes bacterium]|nr:PBP1A family penicillin-binding protein [Bacillota bacterium]
MKMKKGASNATSAEKSPQKKSFNKTLKVIFTVLAFLIILGFGTGTAMLVAYVKDAPTFDPRMLKPAETSYLYDNKGNEITRLYQEQNRTVVPISSLPEYVPKAFVAIEDERFEKHFGVDVIGITRALVVNITKKDLVSQGASTITQQLIRNAFLTPEKTLKRKIQEAWLSIQLEREFSKPEILEMYLNTIYFGNGAYGIEAAAETYFNKSSSDLSLAEGSMLAGFVCAPNSFNPFINEEKAQNRKKTVLRKMSSLGYIGADEAKSAREEELKYGELKTREYPYPYFIDYVVHHELIKILSETALLGDKEAAYHAIYTQGLKIYTTLDTELQAHVEETLRRKDKYPTTIYIDMDKFKAAYKEAGNKLPKDYPKAYIDEENGVPQPQAAMVIANPQTGAIRALGGGREYRKNKDEVLRFVSKRQPGSSIKPVVSYAPAFEEKILAPGSIVYDVPIKIGNYAPRSWDGRYWGPITVREAIKWSRNIPAVSVLHMVSPGKGTEYAERMGISSFSEDDRGALSVALGGVSGISVMDMCQAFATIANEGVKKPLHTVSRIEDRNGEIIFEQNAAGEAVLSPQTAYMITNILEETHRTTFTGNRLYIDRPVAAKTGTTNDDRDTLLAAFTPNLISYLWMGYDFKDMGRIRGGHGLTTSITRDVFRKAFEGLEKISFESRRPSGLVTMEICKLSGLKPTQVCRDANTVVKEIFTPQTAPKETCSDHVEVEICQASGLLKGPYCPDEDVTKEYFYIGKHSEDKPPKEKCNVHTGPSEKVTSFAAIWNPVSRSVTLSWSVSSSTNIKEFKIYRGSSSEKSTLLATVDARTLHYTDARDLKNDTEYTYFLYMVDKQNNQSEPATARAKVPSAELSLSPPTLSLPENSKEKEVALSPVLLWRGSPGATSYTVEVASDENFSNIVFNGTVKITMITVTPPLEEGKIYCWRVKSNDENGSSQWSSVRSFKTKQISPSELSLYNRFVIKTHFLAMPWKIYPPYTRPHHLSVTTVTPISPSSG